LDPIDARYFSDLKIEANVIRDERHLYTILGDPNRQVIDGPFVLCKSHPVDSFEALHSSQDKVPNSALRGLDPAE
jgi:hypothetical protein